MLTLPLKRQHNLSTDNMCCLQPKFDIIIKRTCKCSNLGGELLRIAALFCAGFFYCDIYIPTPKKNK